MVDPRPTADAADPTAPVRRAAGALSPAGTIAPYIREIGRGKEGARSLSVAQAFDLMSRLLDGQISDLELGGFALAMRVKGESPDELTAFVAAAQQRVMAMPAADRPIALPSYNGARKQPNLTPLLAALLACVAVRLKGSLEENLGTQCYHQILGKKSCYHQRVSALLQYVLYSSDSLF